MATTCIPHADHDCATGHPLRQESCSQSTSLEQCVSTTIEMLTAAPKLARRQLSAKLTITARCCPAAAGLAVHDALSLLRAQRRFGVENEKQARRSDKYSAQSGVSKVQRDERESSGEHLFRPRSHRCNPRPQVQSTPPLAVQEVSILLSQSPRVQFNREPGVHGLRVHLQNDR